MKARKLILLASIAICALAIVSVVHFGVGFAQSNSSISTYQLQPTKVVKDATVDGLWQARTVVRVNGMRDVDRLNVRPVSDAKITASAFNTSKAAIEIQPGKQMSLPQSGRVFADSVLTVTQNEITFTRPDIEGKMLVDVQLPESAEVQIVFNGTQIFKSSDLHAPVAVSNGEVFNGENTVSKALNRTMVPDIARFSGRPPEVHNGTIVLPFSELQLKLSEPTASNSVKALFNINEQGIVERVVILEASNIQEAEQTLSQWRFVPYKKDGVAVKVKTFFVKE